MKYIVLFILAASCTIKPPDIKITDEKTALENQILGTYNEIEEDVWMVASIRSSQQSEQINLSKEKESVLQAYQNIEFNKDDVDEFKVDGCVGENNSGLLEILESEKYKNDNQYRALVDQKVAEENKDRMIIINRVIEVNHNLTDADLPKVQGIFAQMHRENAKAGERIQGTDGKWTKIK